MVLSSALLKLILVGVLGAGTVLAFTTDCLAQRPSPEDLVAQSKLDAARFAMRVGLKHSAAETLLGVLDMPGISTRLRARALQMMGTVSFGLEDLACAELAYKRALEMPGADEEDKAAARSGLSMLSLIKELPSSPRQTECAHRW